MKSFSEFVSSKRKVNEAEGLKKEYEEVFRALLDKYEVDSPAELSDEKKVEFFEEIKKHYTAGKGQTEKGKELAKNAPSEEEVEADKEKEELAENPLTDPKAEK